MRILCVVLNTWLLISANFPNGVVSEKFIVNEAELAEMEGNMTTKSWRGKRFVLEGRVKLRLLGQPLKNESKPTSKDDVSKLKSTVTMLQVP